LRSYTSYLAPKFGFFTGDMWTLIATYIRNVILNWVILVPTLILLVLAPQIITEYWWSLVVERLSDFLFPLAVAFAACALIAIAAGSPGSVILHDARARRPWAFIHLVSVYLSAVALCSWAAVKQTPSLPLMRGLTIDVQQITPFQVLLIAL